MQKLFLVGIGGFIGAVFSYIVRGLVYHLFEKPYFPYGTLAVNVTGCRLDRLYSFTFNLRSL